MAPTPASVIYPELPDPLTPGDLQQLFSPSFDERQWAPTVVRATASQVALVVQLKIFQSIGRFRPPAEIPDIAIEHVARRMGVEFQPSQIFPERTRYRHRQAIFKRLGVVSWGPDALTLTKTAMRKTAHARTDPADIINSAIDASFVTVSSCRRSALCGVWLARRIATLTPNSGTMSVASSVRPSGLYWKHCWSWIQRR